MARAHCVSIFVECAFFVALAGKVPPLVCHSLGDLGGSGGRRFFQFRGGNLGSVADSRDRGNGGYRGQMEIALLAHRVEMDCSPRSNRFVVFWDCGLESADNA